jgi:hypothetical protein
MLRIAHFKFAKWQSQISYPEKEFGLFDIRKVRTFMVLFPCLRYQMTAKLIVGDFAKTKWRARAIDQFCFQMKASSNKIRISRRDGEAQGNSFSKHLTVNARIRYRLSFGVEFLGDSVPRSCNALPW